VVSEVPEIGISIFDSQTSSITSQNYVTRRRVGTYGRTFWGPIFWWGKSELKSHEEIREILDKAFVGRPVHFLTT
jgi:hypothetical protein